MQVCSFKNIFDPLQRDIWWECLNVQDFKVTFPIRSRRLPLQWAVLLFDNVSRARMTKEDTPNARKEGIEENSLAIIKILIYKSR